MGVYIKGMEMPKNCGECFVQHDLCEQCIFLTKRPLDCPLVELPAQHGRLIDADALKETLDYYIREAGWSDEINEALTWVRDEFIDHEHTIIEAEKVDE